MLNGKNLVRYDRDANDFHPEENINSQGYGFPAPRILIKQLSI